MGRETRQSRRAKARREPPKPQQRSSFAGRWQLLAGLGVLVVAAVVLAFAVSRQNGSTSTTPTIPPEAANQTVDSIHCDNGMTVGYHVHAHLVIYDAGKRVPLSADTGHNYSHDCMYWVHVHTDDTSVIHLESPRKVVAKLKTYFAIAHMPINSRQIASATVKPGQIVKVFVNQKPYAGAPASIILKPHTNIQIDIGPPFPPQKSFKWGNL